MTDTTEIDVPAGRVLVKDRLYWQDSKGGLLPDAMVTAQDKLQDEMVRKIVGFAEKLSAEIARFREHCFEDVNGFAALLDQEYGVKRGGKKGNMTFMTVDTLMKVTVQVADNIEFGPELQSAKRLVDECLIEWGEESPPHFQAVANHAFQVDKEGTINRGNLFNMLRLPVEDERWKSAMKAIRDSIKIVGSKRYVRIHHRAEIDAPWQAISIDMANA